MILATTCHFATSWERHLEDTQHSIACVICILDNQSNGPPVEKTDANTQAVFGDSIGIYDIQRAVAVHPSPMLRTTIESAERVLPNDRCGVSMGQSFASFKRGNLCLRFPLVQCLVSGTGTRVGGNVWETCLELNAQDFCDESGPRVKRPARASMAWAFGAWLDQRAHRSRQVFESLGQVGLADEFIVGPHLIERSWIVQVESGRPYKKASRVLLRLENPGAYHGFL